MPAHRRPLTPDERKTLADLPVATPPFHLWWDIAIGSVGATGCLGALVILAIVGILGTFNTPSLVRSASIATVLGLVVIVSAISTSMRYSVARRKQVHVKANVDTDVAGGEAEIESHCATAAFRAIMEEHRERAYFIRLEDGRVLFVGFWNPADADNPAGIQDMPPDLATYPMANVEIVRGPASRILLGVTFSGPTLSVSTTFDYRQGLKTSQLDVGAFAPVPWEDVIKTYG